MDLHIQQFYAISYSYDSIATNKVPFFSYEVLFQREGVQEWREGPDQWLRPVLNPQLLQRTWTWFDTQVKVYRLAQMLPTRVLLFSLTNPFMISRCNCIKTWMITDYLVYDWVDSCSLCFLECLQLNSIPFLQSYKFHIFFVFNEQLGYRSCEVNFPPIWNYRFMPFKLDQPDQPKLWIRAATMSLPYSLKIMHSPPLFAGLVSLQVWGGGGAYNWIWVISLIYMPPFLDAVSVY